jgi:hypothetical protein
MKWISLVIVLGYISGSAPWCGADDAGDLNCYYWGYSACMNSGMYVACVANPKRNQDLTILN